MIEELPARVDRVSNLKPNEQLVKIDGKDSLPSVCPNCGSPVKDHYKAVCEYCGGGVTHIEVITQEAFQVKKELAAESSEDSEDVFAGCDESETIESSSSNIEGGRYRTLTIEGSSNQIENITAEELIVEGSSNRLSNCTVKKLIINGSSVRLGDGIKVYQLLRVSGSSIRGTADLAKDAKFSSNGSSNSIKIERF